MSRTNCMEVRERETRDQWGRVTVFDVIRDGWDRVVTFYDYAAAKRFVEEEG